MAAIEMPRDVKGLILLGEKIIASHLSLPEESPLAHIDMNEFSRQLEELKNLYAEYQDARNKAESLCEKVNRLAGMHPSFRTLHKGTIRYTLFMVKDTLKTCFRGSPEILLNWGFCIRNLKNARRKEQVN